MGRRHSRHGITVHHDLIDGVAIKGYGGSSVSDLGGIARVQNSFAVKHWRGPLEVDPDLLQVLADQPPLLQILAEEEEALISLDKVARQPATLQPDVGIGDGVVVLKILGPATGRRLNMLLVADR